ncbi:hypothetical protein AVEN_133968-1 [Araneus ventricosus]|uniref:Uncharacterized protein n=1 Tax=Araneus ventricosus TaxID=182803 RepID=A0A4Y2J814_ARAVE|nr:hypothetical protein AVEN_133968-1 [Araneus ventricosus]
MPGDEVIGDSFQPFWFEVWRWLPHMPRYCINTLRGIVKFRANSTTTAIIAVRQVKPFEVGRIIAMLREEDNILSNPVSGTTLLQTEKCNGITKYKLLAIFLHIRYRL